MVLKRQESKALLLNGFLEEKMKHLWETCQAPCIFGMDFRSYNVSLGVVKGICQKQM